MVERSIAWLTRGNRRLRYRGVASNDRWLHTSVAALNLRRLIVLGLTRHTGWMREHLYLYSRELWHRRRP